MSTITRTKTTKTTTAISNDDEKLILCVGLCVLDIIHVCSTFPEEDSDKRSKHGRWQRGGNASNSCTVLAEMGAACEYLGCLTTSKWFEFVVADFRERGIRIDNCVYFDCDAPLSSVILNEATGSRTILHSNPNLPILTYEHFKNIQLDKYKWIHFEGRNPDETIKMIQMIREWNQNHTNQICISIELEKVRPEILVLAKYADVLFVGKDLAQYLGYTDKATAVMELQKLTESGTIIICTWGQSGIAALDTKNNNELITCLAYPPDIVIDSLGAGDTFIAATISALSNEHSLAASVEFASRIAGAKVGFYGYDSIRDIWKELLLLQ